MFSQKRFRWKSGKNVKVGVLAIILMIFTSSIVVALIFMGPQNYPLLKQESSALYSANYLSVPDNFKFQSVSPRFFFSSSQPSTFTSPRDVLCYYPNRNDSNVDNSASVGYNSAFVNQQIGPDEVYDTLSESNTKNPDILILRPNGLGNEEQLYANSSIVYSYNWEYVNSSDGDASYVYWNGTQWKYDLYHIIDPDVEESGIINWVRVGICVKIVRSSSSLKGDAKILLFMESTLFEYSNDSYNIPESYKNCSVLLEKSPETGDSWTWDELKNLQVGVSLLLRGGTPKVNDMIRCTFAWVEVNYTIPNYELDFEVQWTGVPSNSVNSNLCIKTGNSSGNENLCVEYWIGGNNSKNGDMWVTLIPVLLPNQWNNVSVKIDNPVFTIRFKGLIEEGDKAQDYWNIDVSLIEVTYEPGETYSTSLFLMILGGFLLGGGNQSNLPPAGLIFGAVSFVSVSGLVIRHFFFSGEDTSFRRRRLKQLDEVRRRVQRALEGDENGEN